MSKRASITAALVAKLKTISVANGYITNIDNAVYPTLKFWDEVNNYPSIYVVAGRELREYHPGNFKWGFLGVSLKVYTKGETCQEDLENLLEDLEKIIDANNNLEYDSVLHYHVDDILITSITTDEGLLAPYGVGEMNLNIRYAIMQ